MRGVGIDPKTMGTVLLLSSGERVLPIFIGVAEATAIASELEGTKYPRPQTHDLFVKLLASLNKKIEKVTITDVKGNTYYAVMTITKNDLDASTGDSVKFEIDARPSDAVALALKSNAPIFLSEKLASELVLMEIESESVVSEAVLNEFVDITKDPIAKDEVEAFREFIDNITPEEWNRFLKK